MNSIARLTIALALVAPLCAGSVLAEGTVFRPDKKQDAPAPVSPQPQPPATPQVATPAQLPNWGNPQVEIAYREAKDARFQPIRDRLMKRRVLEQLRLFLAPLKLPRKLVVQIEQCDAASRAYESGGPVTICYEQVERIEQTAPQNPPPGALPRDVMIVGAFVQTVLHQVSLAIFDVLDMPVWGRESDAADRLTAFIMMQFGRQVALKVLIGAALYFDTTDRAWTGDDFASVDSPEAQRLFNFLCIAYGADPAAFKFLLDQNLLPVARARRCTLEFYGLRNAFEKTIMRNVDEALMRKVQDATWLMLDEPR